MLKRLAGKLPRGCRRHIRRIRSGWLVGRGEVSPGEPEGRMLPRLIGEGDWVVDGGANVGQYALALSRLVGPSGRVLAFEPIPETFALLSGNVEIAECENVTLLNLALSERTRLLRMTVPRFDTGIENLYEARVDGGTHEEPEGHQVLSVAFDDLPWPERIALVKLDLEGHEPRALRGMRETLRTDSPILILETIDDGFRRDLLSDGYRSLVLPGSPNTIFIPPGRDDLLRGLGDGDTLQRSS